MSSTSLNSFQQQDLDKSHNNQNKKKNIKKKNKLFMGNWHIWQIFSTFTQWAIFKISCLHSCKPCEKRIYSKIKEFAPGKHFFPFRVGLKWSRIIIWQDLLPTNGIHSCFLWGKHVHVVNCSSYLIFYISWQFIQTVSKWQFKCIVKLWFHVN